MPAVIKEIHVIGGIQINVYKASDSESTIQPHSVAILFLLHGRLQSAKDVDSIARSILEKNNQQQRKLWIVTFDHRNHGQRLVDVTANYAWTDKVSNDLHAMDMYSIQTGTAQDVSFLIDFIPACLFPDDDCKVDAWDVCRNKPRWPFNIQPGSRSAEIPGLPSEYPSSAVQTI